jgi:hypothetical protein
MEQVFKSEEAKRTGATTDLARGLRSHCDMFFSEEQYLLEKANQMMDKAKKSFNAAQSAANNGDASSNQLEREREGLLQQALELYKRAAQFWGKSESAAEEEVQVLNLWDICSKFWKRRALLLGVALALHTAHHVQHARKANQKRAAVEATRQANAAAEANGADPKPLNYNGPGNAAGELLQSQCYEVIFAMLVRLSSEQMSFYPKNLPKKKQFNEYFPKPDPTENTEVIPVARQHRLGEGYTVQEGPKLFMQMLEFVLQSEDGTFHFDLYERLLKADVTQDANAELQKQGENSQLLTKIRSPFVADFLARHDKCLLYRHFVQHSQSHEAAKVMWELANQPCRDINSKAFPLEEPLRGDVADVTGAAGATASPKYKSINTLLILEPVEAGEKMVVGIPLEQRIEYLSKALAQAQGSAGGMGMQSTAVTIAGFGGTQGAPSFIASNAFHSDIADKQDVAQLQQAVLNKLTELETQVSGHKARREQEAAQPGGLPLQQDLEAWVDQKIHHLQQACITLRVSGEFVHISDLYNKYATEWYLWDR